MKTLAGQWNAGDVVELAADGERIAFSRATAQVAEAVSAKPAVKSGRGRASMPRRAGGGKGAASGGAVGA